MDEIKIFKNSDDLSKKVGQVWSDLARGADAAGHGLSVALSGGNTAHVVNRYLAGSRFRDSIPWNSVQLFWGDERCVPPDHSESNYGMVKKALIDCVRIPAANIHRIRGEDPPGEEAHRYAKEIQGFLGTENNGIPEFDWILLGMGEDGHTASLFPGGGLVEEDLGICGVARHPGTGQDRVTLTLPVLMKARRVTFLVIGEAKAEIISKIHLSHGTDHLPAARVRNGTGLVEWYLDAPAASLLTR